ncbi:M1 family aminopeptidase [Brumimicrobium salinarum]|uniref:M1 family aminopeptidase n=1 Tax=Brumimicrobium salinarum TaxID=2058658 RepID=UPI001F0C3CC5|nr:M1 family aminopeptidase [Brumimicrobium salinarum]
MKYLFIISIFLFNFILAANAQEKHYHCSKRNAFQNSKLKSPNLNQQQLIETKKYDVHFYDLNLKMDNLSTDIEGVVEIHGKATSTTDSLLIELHEDLTINNILLNSISTPFRRSNNLIKIPAGLTSGQSFILSIDYEGTPPSSSSTPFGGSGMSNASTSTWNNQVTWSLSEPFSAYEWFPCKQDLRDKADSVAVKLTVPNNCKAGSNGILENVVDLGNGTSRYEWFHRHPIAYYLISVAIGEYDEYKIYAHPSNSQDSILIQNYIYNHPSYLSTFKSEIDETVDFMELFATLYGKYPFDDEKYGHCIAPLGGGMEHQTMTTQGTFEKNLTAHELAHQWWGNSVTCASWADIWINEGFASYSSYLMLEYLYPNEAFPEMMNIHNNVMSYSYGSIWKVDSLNESSIFDGRLTYDKGAAFVHTLRFMMNDDTLFYQTLKQFLSDFKDSTATGLDFRDYLNAASNVNFDQAFDEWYFGEGYPVYNLTYNNVGNDLHFKVSHVSVSSTPTFTNPLEIRFSRLYKPDTTIRININTNAETYHIPDFNGTANAVEIDPNNWIINKIGAIHYDENYTAIKNNKKTEDIKIYPNPSTGIYKIAAPLNSLKSVQVFNTLGKSIIDKEFNNNQIIDLSAQEAGYYIVKITAKNGNQWTKTIHLNQ